MVVIIVAIPVMILVRPEIIMECIIFVDPRMNPARHHPRATLDTVLEMGADVIRPVFPRSAAMTTKATPFREGHCGMRSEIFASKKIHRLLMDVVEVISEISPACKTKLAVDTSPFLSV